MREGGGGNNLTGLGVALHEGLAEKILAMRLASSAVGSWRPLAETVPLNLAQLVPAFCNL